MMESDKGDEGGEVGITYTTDYLMRNSRRGKRTLLPVAVDETGGRTLLIGSASPFDIAGFTLASCNSSHSQH